MGSHLSCMSPAAAHRLAAPPAVAAVRLFDCSTGALSELDGPLTAAEAMMEFPAHFLCALSSIAACRGRRICAVPADQLLQAAELYLLLPMHRLNGRFLTEEIQAFASIMAAQKSSAAHKQAVPSRSPKAFHSKVVPLWQPTSQHALQSRSFNASEHRTGRRLQEGAAIFSSEGAVNRTICRSKSWMPMLETVNEHAVAA